MEEYIQISKINDFLYSPKSLYLHSVYESFDQDIYHEEEQKIGKMNHENIDQGTYSTAKRFIQGLSVYSVEYNIGGKIDIYDQETKSLIERKTKVSRIYDGYRYQLYAQMFCMQEMGYEVQRLFIQSLIDNKRHIIMLPREIDLFEFRQTLQKIRFYNPQKDNDPDYFSEISIYRNLEY